MLTALVVLGAAAAVSPPPKTADDLVARVDAIAGEAIAGGRAGLSIAVVHHGETLLAKGYGLANVELAVPAAADTVYHVASITKHLTAGLVLRLLDGKRLSLDDPVTKYVELPPAWAEVRIRHLLNHTSGSVSYTGLPSWGPQERLDVTPGEILGLVRDAPFHFRPGEAWRYDNTGFYLLGLVVEKVTGQAYGDAMRTLVFEPLGMRDTRYCSFRPIVARRATGYEVDHGALVNADLMSWAAPFSAGSICSTVLDLVRYERALEEHRLFGDALLQEMRRPTALPDGVSIDYGLGTRLGNLEGHRVLGHTGGGGGFNTILERFPEDDLTVVVLANTDGGRMPPSIVASRIARLVLGLPDDVAEDRPVPADELAADVGTFTSEEGTVTTVVADGRLAFRPAGASGPPTPMPYRGNGTFTLAPDLIVRMVRVGGRAAWGLRYSGGLFLDASRRVR